MPMVEPVRATVVLEFDISTTTSNASTLFKIERVLEEVLKYRDPVSHETPIQIRGVKIKSMTVEPKHG
jgi:hypothetical protein